MNKDEYMNYIVDMLQSVGPVYSKKMFGGFGLYMDDIMFGIINKNSVYFKVDKTTEGLFIEEGCLPFTFKRNGKEFKMSYYEVPATALDSMDTMHKWGQLAYDSAIKNALANRKN